jgi:hypothetical protein
MQINPTQKLIAKTAGFILLALLLFPPWQQAALHELDYRKAIGRGFIFHPPRTVPIECYFVGCKTAQASYFHAVLFSRLYIEQCATVFCIGLIALWIFRTAASGMRATLRSWRTRLKLSMLLALAVPPLGQYPLASLLLDIPRQVIHHNELWLIPALLVPVIFIACSAAIYIILALILWLRDRTQHRPVSVSAI